MVEKRERLTLNLPVAPRLYATLTVTTPMTGPEWDRMMTVLTEMRPGLVEETAGEPAWMSEGTLAGGRD